MISFGIITEIEEEFVDFDLLDPELPEPVGSFRVNSNEMKLKFLPQKGDYLHIKYDKLREPESIEPFLSEDNYVEEIQFISDGFGIVGEETIFAIGGEDLQVGDTLECCRIKGEYLLDEKERSYRCVSFRKIKHVAQPVVANGMLEQVQKRKGYIADMAKIDDSFANANNKLRENHYDDISDELRVLMTIQKNSSEVIRTELDKLIPSELNMLTYEEVFHSLLDLDELNLVREFQRYTKEDAAFHPKPVDQINARNENMSRMFILEFEDLHELRPSILKGDIVLATQNNTRDEFTGKVKRTLLDSMHIKFEKDFAVKFDEAMTFTVEFFYSRAVYKKMHKGVVRAAKRLGENFLFPNENGIANPVQLNVHLDNGALKLDDDEIPWFKEDIDDSQKAAVVQALRATFRPLPNIIHGPPGTGKTSTLIEIILHIFTQIKDSRILVAAHSNSAVNLLLSRLIEHDFVKNDIVRLVSLAYQEKKGVREELHPYCATLHYMKKDLDEENEEKAETSIKALYSVEMFRIVIGTCVGLGSLMYDRDGSISDYSHVIVDEAGQCSEPEILIPISKVDRKIGSVVLAGDPMQMPPLVLCKHAKERGLSKSLLERFVELSKLKDNGSHFDHHLISKLLYNYRSVPSLLEFYNSHFYGNELKPTVSETDSPEADILLKIQEIMPEPINGKRNVYHAIYFHNVIGKNKQMKASNSWYNLEESYALMNFVPHLLSLGFHGDDIGVITPYHLQVKNLRVLFAERKFPILVGSVDEFQGLERKIILISTVRTDTHRVDMDIRRRLGIVACPKRTNVAISRARALVVIFGRAELLKRDQNWRDLIANCEENGTFYEG